MYLMIYTFYVYIYGSNDVMVLLGKRAMLYYTLSVKSSYFI